MEKEHYMQDNPRAFADVAKMGRIDLTGARRPAPIPVKYRKIVQPTSDVVIMSETSRNREPGPSPNTSPLPTEPISEQAVKRRDDHEYISAAPVLEITESTLSNEITTSILEERAELERWRNKQRQREKLRQLKLEKENDIGTNTDQMSPDYSVHEESTGGRIVEDRTKLGRNMRARPHRADRGKTDQDLLETLSRQQQLMQRLEQEQRRAQEEDRIKSHAQQLINDTFLMDQLQDHRRRQERSEQMQQLLGDAFPLTGPSGAISNGGLGNAPIAENPALDLLHSGDSPRHTQVSDRSSATSPGHRTQMNGHVPVESQPDETDSHRLKESIREEMNRLQPTQL